MFYVFLGIVVMAVFLQLGGLSITRLSIGIIITLVGYTVIRVIESNILDKLNDNNFKDIYINDNL